MQTTTYGSTQPKNRPLNTSAYTQPTAPLASLFGTKTQTPSITDNAASILAKAKPVASTPAPGTPAQPIPGPLGTPASTPTIGAALKVVAPPNVNDLTQDPVVQQIVAAEGGYGANGNWIDGRNILDANTGALGQAKNAIIGYGPLGGGASDTLKSLFQADPSNPILGALSDTGTLQAAAANPNATLNQLALNDQQRVGQLDSDLNDKNLYYSSTRAAQLGQDANTYRGEQAQATTDLADALSNIYGNVLNTKQTALEDYNNALNQAYQHSLDLAQLGGGAPAGQTSSANGPGGPTTVNTGGNDATALNQLYFRRAAGGFAPGQTQLGAGTSVYAG